MNTTSNNEHESKGKEKNWISITVTHSGEDQHFDYNIHTKIRKVVKDSIKAFGIQPAPNTVYYLTDTARNLNLDDEDKSLQDYNVQNNAILTLNSRCRTG